MRLATLSFFGSVAACLLPLVAAAQDTGTCIGNFWIADTNVTHDDGPDFTVYRLGTANGPVSIYLGCCSEVSNYTRVIFKMVDGERLWRTLGRDGFGGYLIEHRHGGGPSGQIRFFGAGLKGDERDRAFFERVHFGKAAAARCVGKRDQ